MSIKDVVRHYILDNGLPLREELLEVRGYLAAVEDCVYADSIPKDKVVGNPDVWEREPTDEVVVDLAQAAQQNIDAIVSRGFASRAGWTEEDDVAMAAAPEEPPEEFYIHSVTELYEASYTWEEAQAQFRPALRLAQDGKPPIGAVLVALPLEHDFPYESVAYLDDRYLTQDMAAALRKPYIGDIVEAQKAPYVQSTPTGPTPPMAPPAPRAPRPPAKPKLMPPVDPDARAAQKAATARLVAQDRSRVTRKFRQSTELLSERHE